MKIEVFHLRFEDQPVHVATLELPDSTGEAAALDYVYRCTQSVHENWVEARGQFGLEIEPTPAVIQAGGCRSTCVGDYAIVTLGRQVQRFNCMPLGWQPVATQH